MRIPGLHRRGALKVVLDHLAYAKVRMDSTADPLAKLCLMLMPIAYMLSFIAADERINGAQRARACEVLAKCQPHFCIGAGVSADWGLICIAFLRLFDRLNHDISNSADEMEDFFGTVDACFIRGGVFRPVPVLPPSGGTSQPAAAVFITERVRKQIEKKCVFHCGERDQFAWGKIKPHELKELSSSLQTAAKAMKNRVSAKLAGLRQHFSCFALRRIHCVSEAIGEEKEQLRRKVYDSVTELGKTFLIDSRILVYEFREAAPVALRLYKEELAKQPAAPATGTGDPVWFDNRIVWTRFLDIDFIHEAFKTRVSPFTALQTLLRVWMSILDGDSQVE